MHKSISNAKLKGYLLCMRYHCIRYGRFQTRKGNKQAGTATTTIRFGCPYLLSTQRISYPRSRQKSSLRNGRVYIALLKLLYFHSLLSLLRGKNVLAIQTHTHVTETRKNSIRKNREMSEKMPRTHRCARAPTDTRTVK